MGTETISKFGVGTFDHLIFGFIRTNLTVYLNSYVYKTASLTSMVTKSVSKQSIVTKNVTLNSYIVDIDRR